MELFGGPLEVTLDPRAKIQMEEVAASLSKIEREMLKVAMADQRVAHETEELGKRFRAGFISAEQLRGALRSMAGDLPRTAEEFRKADREAEKFQQRLEKLNDRASVAHALTSIRHGFDLVREGANLAAEAIEHVASRTAEFQRYQRIQSELGVSFSEAQAQSGRFVSQGDVAGLAEHFASAHVNLNQQQLGALARGGARLAQMGGTSFEQQSERIFSGIVGGELEVLRRFGPEMAALSGQTHTAQERLQAFIRTVDQLGRPVDDAATSLERFKESVAQAERVFFGNFTRELQNVAGEGGVFHDTNLQLEAMQRSMLGIGDASNVLASSGTMLGGMFGTWASSIRLVTNALNTMYAGLARVAVVNPLRNINNISGGRLAGLVRAVTGVGSTGAGEGGGGQSSANADDMTFGESQRAEDERAYQQAREDALEMAQAAVRKSNDPGLTRRGGGGRRRSRGEGRFAYSVQAAANADREEMDLMLVRKENDRQELLATLAEQQRTAQNEMAAGIANKQNEAAQLAEQERQRGLFGALTEAAHRYDETMFHLRGTVVGAFEDMSAALGGHIAAWAEGKETFGDAMQGMLGDFLKATSKRALMSGTEEAVASLASLAIGDLRGAGLHAAASAGYFTLAGLAGAAGAAVAPSAAGGAAGGAASRDRAPSIAPRSSSTGSAGQNITINFGAPVVAGNPAQAGRLIAGMVRDAVAREGVTIPGLGLS